VTKFYTTSTALLELGSRTQLSTRVLGAGRRAGSTWTGDLYLRGAGDFTFGTAAFSRKALDPTRASSVERLAAQLRRSGLRHVRGRVFGDSTLDTDNGGTPFGPGCPYGPAGRLERPIPNGPRTPIGFDRGLRNATSVDPQPNPTTFAAGRLIRALRGAGISVDGQAGAAPTPARARPLATTRSPSMARLAALVNRPSDNDAADSMLRLIGARVADKGSRAGGAGVISRTMAARFGFAPDIRTGSARRSRTARPRGSSWDS